MTITQDSFTRVNNDTNGNPRYVIHFLDMDVHGYESGLQLTERYRLAIKLANTKGGKKFHNKQYGGGIVFQSYNLQDTCDTLNKLIGEQQ
jgi:hypothetical protein